MRGKDFLKILFLFYSGITPAYAGKSSLNVVLPFSS